MYQKSNEVLVATLYSRLVKTLRPEYSANSGSLS
jgi:hypothetical protein